MIKVGAIVSSALIALMVALSVYGWIEIPAGEVIARHWDINGNPNGYSPRNYILFGMPLFAIGLSALFAAVPFIDPRKENVRKSRGLYLTAWIGAIGIFAVAHFAIIRSAVRGGSFDNAPIIAGAALFVIVLGNFMAKSRSNWFMGIRTPWSLSSEHAWSASNRTAGWLFVLSGIGSILALWLTGPGISIVVLIAGSLAAALTGIAVSYVSWRADSERV